MRTSKTHSRLTRFVAVPMAAAALALSGAACVDDEDTSVDDELQQEGEELEQDVEEGGDELEGELEEGDAELEGELDEE